MAYFVEGLTVAPGGDSNVRRIGKYETLEYAITAAEQVIDQCLIAMHDYGMTVADLFSSYEKFGEAPFIFSDGAKTINVSGFNHFKCAMRRCIAICV